MTVENDDVLNILIEEFGDRRKVRRVLDRINKRGRDRLPSARKMLRRLWLQERNDKIRRDFTGDNHAKLARRHGVAERQIRRIVAPKGGK